MKDAAVFCAGTTPASEYAREYLQAQGIPTAENPEDAAHLLLDVPSFDGVGNLRDGGNPYALFAELPDNAVVYGGNMGHPALEGFTTVDFLQDAQYLAENAAITAHCALQTAIPLLSRTMDHLPVLVIGWGRIGKCLGRLLRNLGAEVTIAARQESHRAIITALSFQAVSIEGICEILPQIRLVYNTVPRRILTVPTDGRCVKIDLASKQGLIGDDVVWARGLPGICAPESSGELIARTFLRLQQEVC